MAFKVLHPLHARRYSRNAGLGLVLVAMIGIVFGLTVVKVTNVGATQGFDHVLRPELLPMDPVMPAPGGAPAVE